MIYAVIIYPKTLEGRKEYSLHIYSKTSSNVEKMTAYYLEILGKHGKTDVVKLVSRDTAKAMKETYYNAYRENWGRSLTRLDRIRSKMGHKTQEEEFED